MTAKTLCPGRDAFVGALMDELSKGDRESFFSHISVCPECRLKFEALAELEAELEAKKSSIPEIGLSAAQEKALRRMGRQRVRELAGKSIGSIPRAFRLSAAAIAGGIVLLLLGFFFIIRIPSPDQTLRGAQSQEIRLIEPGEKLKRAPGVFRWTDVDGKDTFLLSIIDNELATIYYDKTKNPQLRLPVEVRNKLERGKTYLWTVEAKDEDDKILAAASRYFEIE